MKNFVMEIIHLHFYEPLKPTGSNPRESVFVLNLMRPQ